MGKVSGLTRIIICEQCGKEKLIETSFQEDSWYRRLFREGFEIKCDECFGGKDS